MSGKKSVPKVATARVVRVAGCGGYTRMILAGTSVPGRVEPGQFLLLRPAEWGTEPLLPRPMAVSAVRPGTGSSPAGFEILFKVVGEGTRRLARLPKGSEVRVTGPLGRGFEIAGRARRHVLVAGGTGGACLRFLAAKIEGNTTFLVGASGKAALPDLRIYRGVCDKLAIATEDGSLGRRGLVTDLLEEVDLSGAALYACGPAGMLKAVARIAKDAQASCQVSLEARMACGVGACRGCVVGCIDGYRTVCKDGPVFRADQIDWEKL